MDFDAEPDGEWRTAALDSPADLYALWRAAVERSREVVAEVIEERGLDGPASFTWPDGRTPTVRVMLLDMIEEYARHTGHADILREAVDGRVGEGAPKDFTFSRKESPAGSDRSATRRPAPRTKIGLRVSQRTEYSSAEYSTLRRAVTDLGCAAATQRALDRNRGISRRRPRW